MIQGRPVCVLHHVELQCYKNQVYVLCTTKFARHTGEAYLGLTVSGLVDVVKDDRDYTYDQGYKIFAADMYKCPEFHDDDGGRVMFGYSDKAVYHHQGDEWLEVVAEWNKQPEEFRVHYK